MGGAWFKLRSRPEPWRQISNEVPPEEHLQRAAPLQFESREAQADPPPRRYRRHGGAQLFCHHREAAEPAEHAEEDLWEPGEEKLTARPLRVRTQDVC